MTAPACDIDISMHTAPVISYGDATVPGDMMKIASIYQTEHTLCF